MQKKNVLLIAVGLLILIACIAVPVSATIIERDYNLSTVVAHSLSGLVRLSGTTNAITPATVNFTSIAAIHGATNFSIVGIIINSPGNKIPFLTSQGTQTINIALTGAGDSYSLTRNTGKLYFTPISRISSYDILGNPVYSTSMVSASIYIDLNHPMVYLSGDNTTYQIRNINNLTGSSWKYILTKFDDEVFLPAGNIGTAPNNMGFIGVGSGTSCTPFAADSGLIYGVTSSLAMTKYQYQFENKFSIDENLFTWSLNKNPDETWTYPDASVLSQFDITDGTGLTIYYPKDTNSSSGIFLQLPVRINLTENGLNTTFSEVFGAGTFSVSTTPSNPIPNQTITHTITGPTNTLNRILISTATWPGNSQLTQKSLIPLVGGSSQIIELVKNSTGHWQYWYDNVGYTGDLGTTPPTSFQYTLPVSGDWSILTEFSDQYGNAYDVYNNITVSGSTGNLVFGVYPIDSVSGAFLNDQHVALKNLQTNTWTNVTSDSYAFCNFNVNAGQYIWVVTGQGDYSNSTRSGNQYITASTAITVPMQRNDLISTTNGTIVVDVQNMAGASIVGATVNISVLGFSSTTSSTGTVSWNTIPFNNTYSMTISKTGYTSVVKSFTITPSTNPQYITVQLSTSQVVTTATLTPATTRITTGPTTIVPTATGGNYSGFWGPYYQMFHAMGAEDTELGILMTVCMIIILTVIIGIITRGNLYAVNSAAALGFILSCAFGWIYFRLILAGVLWLLIPLVFRRVE